MNNELKPCPFCGGTQIVPGLIYDDFGNRIGETYDYDLRESNTLVFDCGETKIIPVGEIEGRLVVVCKNCSPDIIVDFFVKSAMIKINKENRIRHANS